MFTNFLKIAFRSLLRHKLYAIVLAIVFACHKVPDVNAPPEIKPGSTASLPFISWMDAWSQKTCARDSLYDKILPVIWEIASR